MHLVLNTFSSKKAMKEKEEHIEQLLRERDLERSEVARAASQVDEVRLIWDLLNNASVLSIKYTFLSIYGWEFSGILLRLGL